MTDNYELAGSIRSDLQSIVDSYEDALLSARGAENEIKVSGAGEPVSIGALDARRDCHTDLVYWCRFILDEVNDGEITGQTIKGDSVEELVKFISVWAMALVDQLPDDGRNLRKEMSRHATILESLARGWTDRRIQVGKCPTPVLIIGPEGLEEFVPCTGNLWAVLRERDNGLLPQTIRCDSTRDHEWRPGEWMNLGRVLGNEVVA